MPMSFIKAIPYHSFPEPGSAPSSWGSTWPGSDVQPVAVLLLSFHPLLPTQIHVPAMKQSFCTAPTPACIYLPEANRRVQKITHSFIKSTESIKILTLKYCVPLPLTMLLCSNFSSKFISHDSLASFEEKKKFWHHQPWPPPPQKKTKQKKPGQTYLFWFTYLFEGM